MDLTVTGRLITVTCKLWIDDGVDDGIWDMRVNDGVDSGAYG